MPGDFISLDDEGIRHRAGSRRPGLRFAIALLLAVQAVPVAAAGPNDALNDTGITTFGTATRNNLSSEPADSPGQDARFGRDAAAAAGTLPKVGAGPKGFDFTKIANNGTVLPAGAVPGPGALDWACTYDNVTGLMWEVKVNDPGHLRDQGWIYTWYDSNGAPNSGNRGVASGASSCQTIGRCDTEAFAQDVNAAGMCGHTDWRMPTLKELESLADFGRTNPAIDADWFPNTLASPFWSASAFASNSFYAWYVHFDHGSACFESKSFGYQVRLVRAGR